MLSEQIQNGEGNAYRKTVSKYQFVDAKTGDVLSGKVRVAANDRFAAPAEYVVFPQQVGTDTYHYEPGIKDYGKSGTEQHSFTEQSYDKYGNVVSFYDAGDAGVNGDDVFATIEYHKDESAWIMGKPSHITVTDNNGTVLRERRAEYNGKGNLTKVRQFLADGKVAETALSYDGFGNMV